MKDIWLEIVDEVEMNPFAIVWVIGLLAMAGIWVAYLVASR
jgi:hypothetical protein